MGKGFDKRQTSLGYGYKQIQPNFYHNPRDR